MENVKEQIIINPSNDEVIIRHGEAPEAIPFREGTSISGTIGVAATHLANHSKNLTDGATYDSAEDNPLAFSYLEVNRDARTVIFIEDAGMPWESKYKGQLKLDPKFEKFQINTGNSRTPQELSDLFKMNRTLFETKDKAMTLVSKLRNFTAKIDSALEDLDDRRGNRTMLKKQAVQSNLPESFHLEIPIFKGESPARIEIEIEIDAGDLSCRLVSPEANDHIEETADSLIDAELSAIMELHPTLRVFEI